MHTDRASAQSALDDIAQVEARTKQAAIYGASSATAILWGVVVTFGYVLNQFYPAEAGPIWLGIWSVGLIGTGLIIRRTQARSLASHQVAGQAVLTQAVMILFGFLFLWLLPPASSRQLAVFWPLLFMMGYVIAGLWLGRFFAFCGLVVSALTVIGYLYSGPWLLLWMAICNGGALIAAGLYLRRVGLQP